MTRLRIMFTLAFCALGFPLALRAQQQPTLEIDALSEEGGVVYDFATHTVTGTNGVIVRYGPTILTADRISANEDTGWALAEGKVHIQFETQIWTGEHIRYNYKTREMETQEFRTGMPRTAFATGRGLYGDVTNQVYFATNAVMTAEDYSNPLLKVRAKRIKVIPGEKFEAWHAVVYLGDVPIFYFPYYSRNLRKDANHFNFTPGYRSSYGAFILGGYTWIVDEQLDGIVHLDYRTKRGVGSGADANYRMGRWGEASLRYYYMHDQDPNYQASQGSNPSDRQRLYFSYQSEPTTNLTIKSVVRYQTDPDIIRDFFEGEYRQNPQPSTYFDVNKYWQNFSLDTYVQPRVNNFLETVERLPDVRLTGFRQQVGATPIYYESESSLGYYRRLYADTNSPFTLPNYSAGRADTYHQLLLPHTFFGWLNVTPRVGGRFDYYTESSGPGGTNDEASRGIFNTGAEVSFKASRVWPAVQNDFLEVDGIRHIVQPSLNYVYVPRPNVIPARLPQFDTELPSFRLLPIEYPDYNSIDSIDTQNVLRLGLRNQLQTKRRSLVGNLVDWDIYTDWRLRRQPGQPTFADLYSDLMFKPRSWMTVSSTIRYDMETNTLRMSFTQLGIAPNDRWRWSFGHLYMLDDLSGTQTALGPGNNLFTSSITYRVNENWALQAAHYFEARTGVMQEQAYTVFRDLRSWTAALTVRLRDNVNGPNDFTVAFTFSLKAFPKHGRGDQGSGNAWLSGG